MNGNDFFTSKSGKRSLVIMAFVIAAALILLLLWGFARPEPRDIESEEIDQPSGEVIRHIDQEPEEPTDKVQLVGFIIFSRVGFTAEQQDIIFTTIQDFFTNNYPNIERLSYLQNSLRFDMDNIAVSYFELAADTGETFQVKIDNEGSIFKAVISIYDAGGGRLN